MKDVMGHLRGVWVAMVTPWDEIKGEPRRTVISTLIDRFIQAGVNGLFILGTTGEGNLMEPTERKVFAETVIEVIEEANAHLPVIVHTGHDRTETAIELSRHAKVTGAIAVAISAPSHYHLDRTELEKHFLNIAEAIDGHPVLLYDIPLAKGNPLSGNLLARLNEQMPNIVGAKVSRTDWEAWEEYLSLHARVVLFNGVDTLCLPTLVMGVAGIVSGGANLLPEIYVQLYQAVLEGKMSLAWRCQELINRLSQIIRHGTPISFIKEGVEILTMLNVGNVRRPLRSLTFTERNELSRYLLSLHEEAIQLCKISI